MSSDEIFGRLSTYVTHQNKASMAIVLEQILEGELRFDIDYQEANSGNSLLHVAAQSGSKFMIKSLLRYGASLNVQNHRGNTALHFCFKYRYGELGEYLVQKGADDSIKNVDGLLCREMDPDLM